MSQDTVLLPLLLLLVYLIKRLLLKAKVFDAAATAYHAYSGLKIAHPLLQQGFPTKTTVK